MSPAEQRVARVLLDAREEVLVASAASLAAKAETSDATVVRTVKSLGFEGMDELRRLLAAEPETKPDDRKPTDGDIAGSRR
ncbi:hypothetical protein ACFSKM_16300 [Ancylobacter dichloromethanicus]